MINFESFIPLLVRILRKLLSDQNREYTTFILETVAELRDQLKSKQETEDFKKTQQKEQTQLCEQIKKELEDLKETEGLNAYQKAEILDREQRL